MTTSSVKSDNDEAVDKAMGRSDEKIEDKFSISQRIESIKCLIIGAVSGSLILAPIAILHDIVSDVPISQWEFDLDGAAIMAGLFAIVYRYAVRSDGDDNPMLGQGVVGSFVLTRTLSKISIPSYCTALPLTCGDPFGYLDYGLLFQLVAYGIEGVALFGGAAWAMELCFRREYISKFP